MLPPAAPSAESATPAAKAPPRTVFVTGPRGAGKTRWLQAQIRLLHAAEPDRPCAVLVAEEGRTQMEEFVRGEAGVRFGKLVLPCLCCPAAAQLPAAAADIVAATGAAQLFVEVPAIVAAGMLADFDAALGWPREVVLCLGPRWAALRDRADLPYFQANLLALADVIVAPEPGGADPAGATPPDAPSLTL